MSYSGAIEVIWILYTYILIKTVLNKQKIKS